MIQTQYEHSIIQANGSFDGTATSTEMVLRARSPDEPINNLHQSQSPASTLVNNGEASSAPTDFTPPFVSIHLVVAYVDSFSTMLSHTRTALSCASYIACSLFYFTYNLS